MEKKVFEIDSGVKEIIYKYYTPKDGTEISIDDNFSTMGINSVDFIKIIVNIETRYDFEFYDSDLEMERFKNIRDLRDYIISRLEENKK